MQINRMRGRQTLCNVILFRDDEPHSVFTAAEHELAELMMEFRRMNPDHIWSVAHRFPILGSD